MRANVWKFVELIAQVHGLGPVVEYGARQVQANANLRPLFPGVPYIGCDHQPGPGVDRVDDLEHGSFTEGFARTLILCEMLEHVANPFAALGEVRRILHPGGLAVLTVPGHAFPLHHVPDYWRFSAEALEMLALRNGLRAYIVSQGFFDLPHQVMAVLCRSRPGTPFDGVVGHLRSHLHEVPAMLEGDMLHEWEGREAWVAKRHAPGVNLSPLKCIDFV